MHHSNTLSVGLDVHKDSSAVAYVATDHDAEVFDLGTVGARPCDSDQLVRQRQAKAMHRVFVHNAVHARHVLDVMLTALRGVQEGQMLALQTTC
jgi:hypothetical protein